MDDVKNFSIFVESTENLGILYNDYKKLYKIIDEFLEKIETNIKSLVKNPSEPNDDIKKVVDKFRSDIDIDISHHSIEMDKIKSITNTIKSYRKDVDKLLNRLSSAKDKISFGGNWYRFAINRPKIYYKHIDTDAHEIINKNVRNLNRGLDWVEKIVIDLYNMIDQDLNILTIVDKVYNKKKIYESYDESLDIDEFTEKSHGKLKYDFRAAYDFDTGHALKIVYGLDGAEITNTGRTLKNKEMSDEEKIADIKHAQSNIRKKGNLDHQSKGGKVLAIIDRVTGERLQSVRAIGIFSPGISKGRLDISGDAMFRNKSLHNNQNYIDTYVYTIKVGDTELDPTFKSTHWFKKDNKKGLFGKTIDNTFDRISTVEHLNQGRGAKLNDVIPRNSMFGDDMIKFNHPSKKEIKRDKKINYLKNEISNIKKQNRDLLNLLDKLEDEYFDNKINYDEYCNKKEIYENDISKNYRKLNELRDELENITESYYIKDDIIFDPFLEANNDAPEYNTDMSEAEAKRTLKTLSQGIINNIKEKQNYKVSQYTANIYANIITKNLLPLWSKGFRKVTITLTSYQSFDSFEFKVPKITQDFVSRFIQGRETINGLIHRRPEINIKMSPKIFHSMETPDDAYNFFKAAIKYYDSGIEKYSEKLMLETMKLNHEMKHLISTTKLSGLVSCPMQLLFVFDDVKMNNKDTFKISQSDIKTVNQFIRNIYTRYAAPEKEKKQIVSDLNDMIRELKEYCDVENENIRDILYLPESVNDYLFGKYNNLIEHHNDKWAMEHFDTDWIYHQTNSEIKYLQEKFGVKKLKKIPSDLVAYITIETEAIKDANDKMMISSYCLGKIEIVEWYIELLEVGSKKYIVPHNKPYLENLRTQLLACFKKIMDVKIVNPNSRPIIDIQYPKGYEG